MGLLMTAQAGLGGLVQVVIDGFHSRSELALMSQNGLKWVKFIFYHSKFMC